MTPATSQTKPEDLVYVDLDAPSPWWASAVAAAAVILIVTVLVAPWAIDWDDDVSDQVATTTQQITGSLCRPNTAGLPNVFEPTLASWSRFCEWFIDPVTNTP